MTKAVVITNEESTEDVLSRIVCNLMPVAWIKYRNNHLSNDEMIRFREVWENVLDRVIVIPQDWNGYNMCKLEDVIMMLEEVKRSERALAMVIIDYLQTINESEEGLEPWMISKKLGFYLKKYGMSSRIPVVVFAQLSPGDDKAFSERVQNDRTFYNHAMAAIEINPNMEDRTTRFIFHKDRWNGFQGKSVQLAFNNGLYISKKEVVEDE